MDIIEAGFEYSIRIAELVKYLKEEEKGFPLCDRLLFCGVSAGLAIRKGKKKEAINLIEEMDYIIEIAERSGYLTKLQCNHIRKEGQALLGGLA